MATGTRSAAGNLSWLPGATAILAFVACNGTLVIVALFSLLGITLVINPHVQAAVISLFAVLTLGFVLVGYRDHRIRGPVILSAIGAVLIVGTMYISFSKIVESAGLLALIAGAIWSWRTHRSCVRASSSS